MIKYTSTDIIKRAEQLADLENSDYVSDYEKIALLNESFQILYQKVVNANDKTWINEIVVYDGMRLPDDFYQLSALYVQKSKRQITKINAVQKCGYELKNGILYLSDDFKDQTVVMEYWPVPPTLFLKEKAVEAPYSASIITADKNIYAAKVDGNTIIADAHSAYEYSMGDIKYKDIAIYQNAALIEQEDKMLVFRFDTGSFGELGILIPVVFQDTLYLYNKESHQVVDLDYNVYIPVFDEGFDDNCYIIYFDNERLYQICPDYYICNGNKLEIGERKLKAVQTETHDLFVVSELGKLWKLMDYAVEVIETTYPAICMVSETHVMTRRMFGQVQFMEGLSNDGILDYPNNLYFTLLAYMLAIQFKIKQNADTSALSSLYEAAAEQFFDSLSNDADTNYQMKNVYANRGWIYG